MNHHNKKTKKMQSPGEYVPQFSDGSGWDESDDYVLSYYQHVLKKETKKAYQNLSKTLYKIEKIITYADIPPHKNTYFVPGPFLNEFLNNYCSDEYFEEVVNIEKVDKIPDTKKKLTS